MAEPLKPLHQDVGVKVPALDLAAPHAPGMVLEAAAQHGCTLLRGQCLSAGQLLNFAHRLGVPLPPYRPQYSAPGHPEVVQVGNVAEGGTASVYLNRGGVEWHTDSPGSSHPAGCSLLYCLESDIPDGGGETGFASTVSGYRALPEVTKAEIADLKLVHSFNTFNDQVAAYADSAVPAQKGELRERNADTVDPLVQTHPLTGDRLVYVSHAMVKGFEGIGLKQGRALVEDLVRQMTQSDRIYKHCWRSGDLMVFDNRSCLHTPFPYAYDDYPRTRRLLHQVIIGGRI
ncbi:MAG: TauD/TfdA family dioxygenase [Alphaproteobacteria bacterium]|nr:TauD/TfdA family dioxygenase [Alphaproteobacteria bacterium]